MRGNKTGVEGETDGRTHVEGQEVKLSHPSLTSNRATTDRSLTHFYFLDICSKHAHISTFHPDFSKAFPSVSPFFHHRQSDVSRKSLLQRYLYVTIILIFFPPTMGHSF